MPGIEAKRSPGDNIREKELEHSTTAVESLEKATDLMRQVQKGGRKEEAMKNAEEAFAHTDKARTAITEVHRLRGNQH